MSFINRRFVIEWNNLYPLDYWWRRKYNIPFNSKNHRNVSYIDMYYDWLEEKLYEENIKNIGEESERLKKYKETGEWMLPHVDEGNEEKVTELFDNIDINAFNEVEDG